MVLWKNKSCVYFCSTRIRWMIYNIYMWQLNKNRIDLAIVENIFFTAELKTPVTILDCQLFFFFFYLNKEDEVFEGCVEVGLLLQLHDWVKVLVVDVSIDSEQALQDGLCHWHEVSLEGDTLVTGQKSVQSDRFSSEITALDIKLPAPVRQWQKTDIFSSKPMF